MPQYQSGVIAPANSDALFITLKAGAEPAVAAKICKVLSGIPETEQQFRNRYPDADIHITAAIGSQFWNRLKSDQRPAQLSDFPGFTRGDISAPDTPVDLLLHIRSDRHDLNYEASVLLMSRFDGAVTLVEEVHGFRYLDSRDLTGFVDGTENPEEDHRAEVALVGAEDPLFSGGSYVHIQRYEHDLDLWNSIAVKQQEDIIGRTKADNIEYPGDKKPLTAHIKRVSVKDGQGRSLEILRHSMPYGNLQQRGLLFASYCASPEPFTLMLKSMIEGDSEGHTDHLMKYSRAVTGQSFFAPSTDWLEALV